MAVKPRFAPVAALLLAAAVVLAQDEAPRGPATIRITGEGVVAQFTFDKGVKLSVTSKPVPVKPGEYRTKKLSLVRADDRKRPWELRCTRLSEFEIITIDPGQEKVLMLGKTLTKKKGSGTFCAKHPSGLQAKGA